MKHRVFIASSGKNKVWATALQERLDDETSDAYEFVVWDQDIFQPSSFAIADLQRVASTSDAAIFIFAPDDEITICDSTMMITRDNVLFEFGLFAGHLGIERTVILAPTDTATYRLLTDLNGLGTIRFPFRPHSDGSYLSAIATPANKIKRHLQRVLEGRSTVTAARLKNLGLVGATDTTEHSSYSYVTAIDASTTQFMLMGVGADKVTSNEQRFVEMVKRIIANGGHIRLLLLDPSSHAMTVMEDFAGVESGQFRNNVKNSLLRIRAIIDRLQCRNTISIRSYFVSNHTYMPPFRLTFINNDKCIASPRTLGDKNLGKLQPQLVFENTNATEGPNYYGAFLRYFEAHWRQSNPETVESMIRKIDEFPKRTALVGCVHGRFQPPHRNHKEYILTAKARCDVLFIGITQPDIRQLSNCQADPHRSETSNNPLTFNERAECLRRMLSVEKYIEGRDYVIVPFDIDRPDTFQKYIPNTWMQYTTLIDEWNVEKKARLEELGYDVQVLYDRRGQDRISGTKIRYLAKIDDDAYREMVTPEVFSYLQGISFGERLKGL